MTEKPTYGYTDMKHWLHGAECFRRYAASKELCKTTPSMTWGSWFHFYLTDAMRYRTGGCKGNNQHGLPPKMSPALNDSCNTAARYGAEYLSRSPIFSNATQVCYEKQYLNIFSDYIGRASFDSIAWHENRIYLIDFKTYSGTKQPWLTRQEAFYRIRSYDYDLQMALYQKCFFETDLPIYWAICWFHKDVSAPIVDVYEPGHTILSQGRAKLSQAEINIATQYSDDILYRLDQE